MPVSLFDLDGTLIDSSIPIRRSMNIALEELGLGPMTDLELHRHIGPPLSWSVSRLLEERGFSTALAPRVIATYRADYVQSSIENAVTYPGIPDMLNRVGAVHPIGVVTSKPLTFSGPILDVLGLSARLAVIEAPDISEAEHKEVTLGKALEKLAVAPSEAIMIGDRSFDIFAARAVGTVGIGVTWGFGTRRELDEAGADRIVDSVEELSSLLTRWPTSFRDNPSRH